MADDVSRILGAEAAGWPVAALGAVYCLMPPTDVDKAKFETLLKSREKASLGPEFKRTLSPDDFTAAVKSINRDIALGCFAWGGPIYYDSLNRGTGRYDLAMILLQKHHPGITAAEVRLAWEDNPEDWLGTFNLLLEAAPNSSPPPAMVQLATAGGTKTMKEREKASNPAAV